MEWAIVIFCLVYAAVSSILWVDEMRVKKSNRDDDNMGDC